LTADRLPPAESSSFRNRLAEDFGEHDPFEQAISRHRESQGIGPDFGLDNIGLNKIRLDKTGLDAGSWAQGRGAPGPECRSCNRIDHFEDIDHFIDLVD
jgi:hypothetical protein